MTFFYDLNKRLADIAKKQEAVQLAEEAKAAAPKSQLAEALDVAEAGYSAKAARAGKDIGKPGKNFAKIAKGAAERYGSKEAGERVAGAVLNKLRHPKEDIENEGNAFTGALASTPKGGKFKVGGKEFTDTSSIEEEGGIPTTPKQKAFAKLAPPADKITFADKIAGAKKEVDEMLGDVAADAIKAAVGRKKIADEGERSSSGGTIEKTKHGIRHIAGKRYAAMDVSDERDDDDEDDDTPKKKGRKAVGAGKGKKIGAKVKGTSKLHKKDAIAEELPPGAEPEDAGEYGQEGDMAKDDIHTIVRHAKALEKILGDDENLPEWVQSKLAKIQSMMTAVDDYMQTQHERDVETDMGKELDEKAVSKKQQKFMGMVHAAQKGEKPASKEVAKVAKTMKKKDAEDFASTKHKGLPEKVKAKKDVEETSDAPKAGKGMQFGKGVYESLDRQFKQALTESIQVQETMEECGMPGLAPEKGITIQASGEDAMKLMQLLKLAGLAGGDACPGCGHSPCDCDSEMVDENNPNWPTDEETLAADPNLRTYSGGLNGPKSTGQTTVPVIASQGLRQSSMEENVELERTLFNLYKGYKAK